jgi:uncharacterized protein YjbJ (UPF0337 family)
MLCKRRSWAAAATKQKNIKLPTHPRKDSSYSKHSEKVLTTKQNSILNTKASTTTMSSNNKDQTSTLQGYVDQATGAHTHLLQVQGENKKDVASAEKDLSHATAKAGPFSVSSSGGVAKDDPDRTAGAWNQNVGAAKEALGGFVGAQGLKQEGQRQNQEGKGQEAAGQMSDLGKGISDRVGGTIGGAVAGITGNAAQKTEAQRQHDEGKARQRGVEADLQKEAPQ